MIELERQYQVKMIATVLHSEGLGGGGDCGTASGSLLLVGLSGNDTVSVEESS